MRERERESSKELESTRVHERGGREGIERERERERGREREREVKRVGHQQVWPSRATRRPCAAEGGGVAFL